jgi:hypothetical protein
MISNCPNCGLLKSTGAMGYSLPQCLCQWKDPITAQEWFSEIMGAALFDFQEATGCDSAEEYKARCVWVDLTDEEIEQAYETTGHYQKLRPQDKFAVYALARAVAAKLKEKNNV